MIKITLAELVADVDGAYGGAGDAAVTGISSDTRALTSGSVFAAIKGERVDGASLAAQALEAGAVAVLTSDLETALASGAPREKLIVVDDVYRALGRAARANLARIRERNSSLRVVAVTGSVGKTTTKDLLAAMLAPRGPIIAPPGSFNNELGLPMTVLRADEETATLVLEMGADHIGDIDYLTSIAPPDVSAVLIVARAHLGEFGGIDNVARAKSELVTGTRADGVVVLNGDDPRVAPMADLAHGPVVFFSAKGNESADVVATNVHTDSEGHATFTLTMDGQSAEVALRLVGIHHVANALAAASIARAFGGSIAEIATVLRTTGPVSPHRMDVWDVNGVTIIDDSYNANPDSMRAGIAALGQVGGNRRKIAVLGAMLELGDASVAEHGALIEPLIEASTGILVSVGNETEPVARAAADRGIDVYRVNDVDEGLDVLRGLLHSGDVVLLKGSHGSGIWRIADALKESD